ncbi:MAG: ATP phosphoribosyltransferase regulatory subunit, partial [Bacilli bacterium]|nr:ATP phosphoribosyltransferase regulatory subunit [Bacilli bacterium]
MLQKPKGTMDIYGKDAKKWIYIQHLIHELCEKYNYTYIKTPTFEASELFHRGVGESTDIITKETYDFIDRGDRAMTLKPEGTAGVVRSFIENKMFANPIQPVK